MVSWKRFCFPLAGVRFVGRTWPYHRYYRRRLPRGRRAIEETEPFPADHERLNPERRSEMCSPDTIVAKYEGFGVDLLSKSPLVGSIELAGEDDEVINLKISKSDAERLVSELSKFIAAEVPA
ncbi:MAG: hypothetical protein EPN45_12875 [Rhizobiaceae bacterium]|nr:MAG: hypothetical protein EPN45_12875 [Rhizobiaceae bacterium]